MQIAIFKQPWRIKVKETLGFGHHYCPLRRSIPQPRDVNAIEQLRTAREATTIDSCGYRCAGGQCAQPGTAYRRSRPDCGLLLKLDFFSRFGPPLGRILGVHVVSCGAIGALSTSVGLFYIEAAAETTRACARFVLRERNVTMCLNDPSLCQHLRSCALVPSPHGFGAVQLHQKSRHFVRQISRSFIERLQFLSNRGAHGAVRCYFCVRQRFVA
jgi:hypothetical protein